MKRYVAFAALTALLAGCTSTQTLRDSKPTAVYEGGGTAEDVATCVNAAWSSKPVHLSTIVLYSGTTIELRETEGGPVVALVDIKPVGAKTVATYYSQFSTDDTWYFDHVESCMDATPAG
ncbi:hypothetical protein [Dyella sp. RRB7]|uniref:hypothetical protein n=1 Tax=Dyella sp. RRB7 TaxID=2919502 RepID=UPI001FAAD630|nr:hypothetical protein [Dyella sp. RRB7]